MKRKTVLAVVCILLAIVIGFVLIPQYNEQQYKKVMAVIAAQDIPAGTQITADMLTEGAVFAQSIPSDTTASMDGVVGKYASRDITKADYVTESKLADTPVYQEMAADGDKQVVSVTIPSAAAGVSGALEPGDVVAVYVIPQTTTQSSTSIVDSVVQVESEDGVAEEESAAPVPTPTPEIAAELPDTAILPNGLRCIEVAGIYTGATAEDAGVPVTVSFYATEEQAKELVNIESGATLHLALLARGDARLKYMAKEDLKIW